MALGGKKKGKEQEVSMREYLDATVELEKLKKEQGIEVQEKGLSRIVSSLFEKKEDREKVLVSRKTYLLVTILTGWFGGHRFMAKQYLLGAVYLLLFWTGIPFAMTLIDLMVAIPIPPDEEGRILV